MTVAGGTNGVGTWGPTLDDRQGGQGNPQIGLDPTTGVSGVKFDKEIAAGDTKRYFITVYGLFAIDEITVVTKAGSFFDTAQVEGPADDCTECGDLPDEECDDGNNNNDDSCLNDCTLPVCGNGVIDGDEQCDNGGANSDSTTDACRLNCTNASCGDGTTDSGETCDDGNESNDDSCRNNCTAPTCGDGIMDAGEACDNGGANSDSEPNACRTDCSLPSCGDEVTDSGEGCDDGNEVDGDACRNNCTEPVCGDGIVDAGESCDDGNDSNSDSCRNNCTVPACGDGIVDAGEACDDGASNSDTTPDACRNDCSAAACGDGVTDAAEACDDGNDNNTDACRNNCTAPVCGDGIVNSGEACDDGNAVQADSCHNDCTLPDCGDGIVDTTEECDNGEDNSDSDVDACRTDCVNPSCGDGVTDTGEGCDDQNGINTDGCHNDCSLPVCGDGIVDPGEGCDDGAANSDTAADACRTDCTNARCGDTAVDTGEMCDDGNMVDTDACRNNCTAPVCGDGMLDSGEECDQGAANSDITPDACRTDCTDSICGDAVTDSGEQCDDTNAIETDGCRSDCMIPACGDGVLDAGETCDDGAGNSDTAADACRTTCVPASCGDGATDTGETCDDGNAIDTDACRNDCTAPVCGDSIVDTDGCRNDCSVPVCGDAIIDAGEACDNGAANSDTNPDACRLGCALASCGDGVTDSGEGCDDGNAIDTDACRNDCSVPSCGDGIVDAGEECDDGNAVNTDGCRNSCTLPTCGDGIVDAGETCDNGAANSDTAADACRTTCVPASCGDGATDTAETCDDGNAIDTDACRNDCTAPECGDGIVDAGETCDDGNAVDTDGCRNDCSAPACGDGIMDAGEACDDGAANSDTAMDACRTSCEEAACGDGVADTGEQCDDRNTDDGDGCSSTCQIPAAVIGDFVWFDVDRDGVQDAGEPGIAGIEVRLYASDGTLVASTNTDASGNYEFTGVVPGDYYIDFIPPAGYDFSPLGGTGNTGVDSNADPVTGQSAVFTVEPGETDRTIDTGLNLCGNGLLDQGEQCDDGNGIDGDGFTNNCTLATANVGDLVWFDVNRNGTQDPGESAVQGVTVLLYRADGTLVQSLTTDVFGNYLFLGVEPGDYYLNFVPLAGYFITDQMATADTLADSDVDPATGNTPVFTLTAGDTDRQWDLVLHSCGNGAVQSGEECDDGNTDNFDACRNTCERPACGDGIVDAGEECDDGNISNFDSCRSACILPVCGDGIVDGSMGEQCDDNNTINGDGCDNACMMELGAGLPTDLSVVKLDMSDPVMAGTRLTYLISVTNNGPGVAENVTVTDILDNNTSFVNASGDCGACVESPAGLLTCDCTVMAPGTSKMISLTVDVDFNTPFGGELQNGDCDGTEDICDSVFVSTTSTDTDSTNNFDDEPTDVLDPGPAGSGVCGNLIREPGEQCDPPNQEDCGNGVDDDGDGLVDCDDPNCPNGVDAVTTCGMDCRLVPACQAFQNDPAEIKFGKKGKLDKFKIHARFNPLTPVDLYTEEVSFSLTKERGLIWHAKLYPGDMRGNKKGTAFQFKDKYAKKGNPSRGGITKFKVKYKLWAGTVTWPFFIEAYADFSRATLPDMTSQITLGDDIGYLNATWSGSPDKRWRLTLADFFAQQKDKAKKGRRANR